MPCLELGCLAAEPTRRTRGLLEGPAYLLIYACEELHQYRVREVWPAREVAVARTAVRVGGVWQARERTLEVEEKDAVPFREMNEATPAFLKHLSAS